MRGFSAREGVYMGGGLRIVCKHPNFAFRKEFRVSRISEKDGAVTWKQCKFVLGTSSKTMPMLIVVGKIRLEVTTTLVEKQSGFKVQCSIQGTIPGELYDCFSVKPVTEFVPKQKTRQKKKRR
jgi:hypothetical protein